MRRSFTAATLLILGCGGPEGEPVELTVPTGASFSNVVDTLHTRGIIGGRGGFTAYARLRGADHAIRSGRYALRRGERWKEVLATLTQGRVLTETITIPEGFRVAQMAETIAGITGLDATEVHSRLVAEGATERWDVPGPTLEGFLFPDTYRFAPGVPLDTVVEAMVARYEEVWTPPRVARLAEIGMSKGEITTLASIIQAEARQVSEMPQISSVYHNRIRRRMPLQADPTVIYALGGYRERLLFAAIDSVADSPYNTYTNPGLPPGPIGAPGEAALDAALHPAAETFLYFVARPDGSHIFTRSLREHNHAVSTARAEWDDYRRRARTAPDSSAGSEP